MNAKHFTHVGFINVRPRPDQPGLLKIKVFYLFPARELKKTEHENKVEDKEKGNIWRFVENTQKTIMVIASIFIVISICAIVTMRYVFEIDLYGIEEIIMMVSFWLYFLGSSMGSCEKSQISADILSTYITNEKYKRILALITSFITTGICMLVTVWALQFILWSMKMSPKTPVFRLPVLIPQSAILAGFCLMSFYHLYYLIKDTRTHVKLVKISKR